MLFLDCINSACFAGVVGRSWGKEQALCPFVSGSVRIVQPVTIVRWRPGWRPHSGVETQGHMADADWSEHRLPAGNAFSRALWVSYLGDHWDRGILLGSFSDHLFVACQPRCLTGAQHRGTFSGQHTLKHVKHRALYPCKASSRMLVCASRDQTRTEWPVASDARTQSRCHRSATPVAARELSRVCGVRCRSD